MDRLINKYSILNSYEQIALLQQPNDKAPTGLRNLCMLRLMLKSGLRVREIINLVNSDISWQESKIVIQESSSAKNRTLTIDQKTMSLLMRWRNIMGPGYKYFFTTLKGHQLNDRYIREMVKRLARKAGIEKDVYPGMLRSTFAVNLIRETKDIELAQNILGQISPVLIQKYTRLLLNSLNMVEYGNIADSNGIFKKIDLEDNRNNLQKAYLNNKSNNQKPTEISRISGQDSRDEEINEDKEEGEGEGKREGPGLIKEEFKQTVSIEVEGNDEDDKANAEDEVRLSIPPLKCSKCSYILRYKEDCPYCGASFADILRHWGKNI